jgi:hypothetical protein
MQKAIFSFIFMILAVFTLQAQDVQPAPVPADPNAPEISFDKIVHDFGTVVQNSEANCEFKFTNTGKEPLIVQKPVSSCGCTVPSWPQEPVLPGKSDVVKVTYSTHNVGPINKTITVTSNAKTSRVVLSIKGNVVAKPADKVPEKTNDNSATPIQK